MMSTHIGNIGRLPREIREQVNQRLENGEPGGAILAWLNGQPAAQAILAARFGGKPVNEPNLSHWRAGGYQERLKQKEMQAALRQLTDGWAQVANSNGPRPAGYDRK